MFNFIFKNLFRRKTRTLLTVLGIAVGVSMIVALGAIGEGMRSGYASMFGGSGADLTLMQAGSYDITMSGVDEQVVADIAAVPGVKEATGMLVGNVNAPGAAYFFIFGYDPHGFAFEKFRVVEGQALGQARRIGGQCPRDHAGQAGRRSAEDESRRSDPLDGRHVQSGGHLQQRRRL